MCSMILTPLIYFYLSAIECKQAEMTIYKYNNFKTVKIRGCTKWE
jgi:hypothetical protein